MGTAWRWFSEDRDQIDARPESTVERTTSCKHDTRGPAPVHTKYIQMVIERLLWFSLLRSDPRVGKASQTLFPFPLVL